MALIYGFLLAVLVVKGVAYVVRWYEVTGAEDFPSPEGGPERLRHLVSGAGPFLIEYGATVAAYAIWVVDMPLRLWFRRRPPSAVGAEGGLPVILVHGLYLSPWSMAWLRSSLRRRRFGPLYLLDYHPIMGRIDGFVDQLADLVRRVAGEEGQVDLVAHSMGGLISARYLGRHPGRVRRLVTVGTPFHGSRLWAMSVSDALPQMRPGSAFLEETLSPEIFPGATRVTSIYSSFDEIVLPYASSRLPHDDVRNVEIAGVGHAALLFSPAVAREVAAGLAD